jgi:glyoxylase-like metal-dependent hydrolase (beta-lactamase superfamily II)
MTTVPTSIYFALHELADGVYAAIAKEASPAFSNAGIIDTGNHTLIFDTFNTFHAAQDLRRAGEILTRRRADYVIISHAHSDHWMGNQVFADHASILTTQPTEAGMREWAAYLKDLKRHPGEYETYIAETEKRLAETTDERLRAHLSWSLVIERHEFKHLRSLRPELPDQIFDGHLAFHGSQEDEALHRKIAIFTPGTGHTESDIVLNLPDEAIAFIGDLGFFSTHPFLGSSTPEKWIATLDALAASATETFVPGHGPVGTKEDLVALKEYILALQEMAADVVRRGGSEDEAAAQPVPEFSSDWAGFGRFERSMRFLYQCLTEPEMEEVERA